MNLGAIVLLHGTVKGMGREAECEILARRAVMPVGPVTASSQSSAYTDCSVIGAPHDLPDGEYTVQFECHTFRATRHHGLWLSRSPALRTSEVTARCD